jgi:hypothetical protein
MPYCGGMVPHNFVRRYLSCAAQGFSMLPPLSIHFLLDFLQEFFAICCTDFLHFNKINKQRAGAMVPSVLSIVRTSEVPPTHFKTNKFTNAYQEIVNAYGMAHYREINPGIPLPPSIFPFLCAPLSLSPHVPPTLP